MFTFLELPTITIHRNNKHLIIENDILFSTNKSILFLVLKRNLSSYSIPDSVTILGEYSFQRIETTTITLPNSVTTLRGYCFYYSKTTTITLSNSLTTIGDQCFEGSKIITLTIPESVKSIGYRAFSYCESLTKVTFLGQVDTLGSGIFYACYSLELIIFPNSSTIFDVESFITSSLRNVRMSFTHKTLFSYYAIGTNVNISISYLDDPNLIITTKSLIMNYDQTILYEFWGYKYNSRTITIHNSVIKNCEKAFENSTCNNIKFAANSTLSVIGESAFRNCSSIQSISLPSSIQIISDYAFSSCNNLQSIIFTESNSLEKISINSISNCKSLSDISNFSSEKYICNFNTLYYKNETGQYLIYHLSQSSDKVLIINCQVICSYSFNFSNNIENISISSNSVSLIQTYSFNNCSNLKYINFPLSVETVESFSFNFCNSIRCPVFVENRSNDYINMIQNSGIPKNLIITAPQGLQFFVPPNNNNYCALHSLKLKKIQNKQKFVHFIHIQRIILPRYKIRSIK